MKVSDLVKELNLTVFCGEAGLDAEISGGYTSDLLSRHPERCGCRPDRERGFAGRGDA